MILREDLVEVGKVGKPHGIKGELSCWFSNDAFDIEEIGFVFLCIDGIFVPFFINSCRPKGKESLLLHFDDITNEQEAIALSGLEIFIPKSEIDEDQLSFGMDYFVGFELYDATMGRVGVIDFVDTTTANVLFAVDEYLIPVSEDLITEIDAEKRILRMSLPEGLLEL